MISKYTYNKITWIDLEDPTKEEIISFAEKYDISPLVAEELVEPTTRSKVDKYDNLIYLILHFPVLSQSRNKGFEQEIDFVIGKDFLITTHYETIDSLHEFSKIFETNSILNKSKNMGEHAGFVFFYIIRELYKHSMLELDDINKHLVKIENNIFEDREGEMVKTISVVNKKLLDFKQAIRFHKEVLRSFEIAGEEFFGDEFSYYLSAITGEYNKIQSILESHKEILNDLRETNDSLLGDKTSNTMKTLTIMSFVIFPLTLIASIFGMNTKYLPIIGRYGDFWIIIGIMLIATLGMYAYFKKKKWI